MTRYQALALTTEYWKPGSDYLDEIARAVKKQIKDGDFVVISEKAISTAKGNILDESKVNPSLTAKILATIWMPIAWGFFLGVVCRFGQRLIKRLRMYPYWAGTLHKQVALQYAGFFQGLMFGSEGGIDGSNLPYSLVSLPLKDANETAELIRIHILRSTGKQISVLIVDTDKTYKLRNFYFTPRPKPMKGICSRGGIFAYIAGRALQLRRRPTALAVAGKKLPVGDALTIANVADRARGPGSGATVWDMAARFKVETTGVTWDMLTEIEHKPIVLVRRKNQISDSKVKSLSLTLGYIIILF